MSSIIQIVAGTVVAGGVAVGGLVAAGVISFDQFREPMQAVGLMAPGGTPGPAKPNAAPKAETKTGAPAKVAKADLETKAAPAEGAARELTPDVAGAGAKPTFDVVRVEPSGDAVVAGGAEPGAIIALLSDGKVVGKGVANKSGQWAIVLERPLPPGDHELSISAMPATGGDAVASEDTVAVAVPDEKNQTALVVLNKPDAPTKVLQVPEPEQKAETVVVKDAKAPADAVAMPSAAAGQVTVEAVESEKDTLYVAGTGRPGSTVRIYVDDAHVGDSKVGAEGRWLLKSAKGLAPGRYGIRADQLGDESGAVIARAVVSFERGEDTIFLRRVVARAEGASGTGEKATTVKLDELPSVIIRPGDNLWRISRRLYGEGVRYTTIYQANKDQIGNPDLIFPGQVFLTPAGDKNWTN